MGVERMSRLGQVTVLGVLSELAKATRVNIAYT